MDFLSHSLAIVGLLALIVLYKCRRNRANFKKSKSIGAPSPSGEWPLIGHLPLLGGKLPVARTLEAMAEKYGPVYSLRLGSHQAVVVSSWEAVKECFTINDKIFATRPSLAVGKYLGYDHAVFALAPYGPYWRDVRKMVTMELFTSQRLEKLKHVHSSELDSCMKDLYLLCLKNGDHPTKVAMNNWFEHVTFNISIRMLVGKRFSTSTCGDRDSNTERFKEAIKRGLYLSGFFVLSDAIPWLEWMDFGRYLKAMKQTGMEIDSVIANWLEEHIEKRRKGDTGGEEDFMDVMLSTLAEGTILSGHSRETIIKATTMILISAGSEATGETLIWALSLLLNNRHVLKRAQEELDVHIRREKWVEESDIQNLTYLQAIVKETLRLYPPGPLAGPRQALEDCYINGYYVPKGTCLIVNLLKLHKDKRVWTDPYQFQPERFLTTHANVNFKGQHYEYIPFSTGRRMCPGLTFGSQVVHLTLARVLQGFDITTPMNKPVDMREGSGLAMPKISPLEVILTPRLPPELYQNLETLASI
ncbi:hypothetical protein F0562_002267 [Nyssa sinensis]|uniref:Uncharacterized protein n=1 Tax=Nyssa sinensis TaxID=561372 RepID=A0A5J5C5B4_9ASTE|nr:hypothetical protein F0562_002267 [Nyssa sinensis]